MKFSTLAVAAGLVASASAHYHVVNVNGDTASLRQHYKNPYQADIDTPVTSDAINTDDIVCGANRPFTSPGTPLTITAGSTVKVLWTSVYHLGPSAIWASSTTEPPFNWVKVWEQTRVGNQWSSDIIEANGHTLSFPVPTGMANGRWLFRIEHLGLHVASSVGGAQFYIRCFDANIVGGGSSTGSPVQKLPGVFTTTTPGVVWNPYSGDQSAYPQFGGPVASFSGGSSNPVTTTTTRTTTTTTSSVVQNPPTTTTTTQPPRTTTTTTTAPTGQTVAKYGQCGGQGYNGPTTCASGSTCKFSNTYYSQCL
ncbi:hypothetical protein HDV00_009485 [Rhizophlyctis rosea]|nr:hypothetical protein HDV00_009485 [Rhizophlyctis rosea]